MRSALITGLATAVGAAVISISSIMIYQHVMYVQVVPPAAVVTPASVPVVEPGLPPGARESMELEDAKPAGRFLPMPNMGRE